MLGEKALAYLLYHDGSIDGGNVPSGPHLIRMFHPESLVPKVWLMRRTELDPAGTEGQFRKEILSVLSFGKRL